MIIDHLENITTPPLPVKYRCPEPCNETWYSYLFMLEHIQEGCPSLLWEGDESDE